MHSHDAGSWRCAHTLFAGCLTLLAATLGSAERAHASCASPKLELLWSYPEDGASDVPTNATFWALASVWGAKPKVTLNGSELDAQATPTFSAIRVQPESLQPNTAYALVLDYSKSAGVPNADSARFEIKFATGAGVAPDTAATPDVMGTQRTRTAFTDHECADVIQAQDCFDTGQNTLLSFDVSPSDADGTLAFMVENGNPGRSALWPVRCGAPSVYIHSGGAAEPICYNVSRVGAGGKLSEPVEACAEPERTPNYDAGLSTGVQLPESPNSDAQVPSRKPDAGAFDAGELTSVSDSDAQLPSREPDAGAFDAGELTPVSEMTTNSGCSTVDGVRTAARSFWAMVVICLLVAQRRSGRRRARVFRAR